MPHDRPPEPWHSFLAAIDETAETAITLHCIGGFALAMLYGLPRPTGDVDCLAVIPAEAGAPLRSLAGEGSVLHGSTAFTCSTLALWRFPKTTRSASE